MRLLLAGSERARGQLRVLLAHAGGDVRIVGEFASAADAVASHIVADAIMVAPDPISARRERGQQRDALDAALERAGSGAEDGVAEAFDEALTSREIQVLELLAEGLPNKGIAAGLGISDQTVKFHLASIMGKLGAANRVDTVKRAVRRGLIAL